MIKAYYKAIRKIIIHKWAVLVAGRKLHVPLKRLLLHDLSKLTKDELPGYVDAFEIGTPDSMKFRSGWEHHWRNNDHHWEYWQEKNLTFAFSSSDASVQNYNKGKPSIGGGMKKSQGHKNPEFWMPDDCLREMIADWMAASYAYEGSWPQAPNWEWGNKNLLDILMKLEMTTQPETTTRGFAVQLLNTHNLITEDQHRKAMTI